MKIIGKSKTNIHIFSVDGKTNAITKLFIKGFLISLASISVNFALLIPEEIWINKQLFTGPTLDHYGCKDL